MNITEEIYKLKKELLKKNSKEKVAEYLCKAVYAKRPLSNQEAAQIGKEVGIKF